MSLNPVETSAEVFARFCGYISTSFRLNNEELNQQIQSALKEPGRFARGPILEVTLPFKLGSTIGQLINEGVLSAKFKTVNKDALPLDRSLYVHQEDAVKKVVQAERNIVVATGTGSGKTESFMIPILDYLFKQAEQNTLTPGVRALLLYPMNALANDQIKRLRKLLANNPEITFGIYTGETEEHTQAALEKYHRMYRTNPLPNELISREQMKENPPHILITNYAMLEYLMLRPADNVFFQGRYAADWKFIVLDEAHTYTGAKGIEMSMLLARLKHTIGSLPGELRCILTSASLGRGREDAELVAKFASDLFRDEFTADDIITAVRLEQEEITKSSWGRPDPKFYKEIHEWITGTGQEFSRLHRILAENGIPAEQVETFLVNAGEDINRALYELLRGDERIIKAITLLTEGPLGVADLASELFADSESAEESTISLIELCNQARPRPDDNPLLPARFHFFVKALEGAYIVLSEQPKVYLERLNHAEIDGIKYRAFELGACTRCHGLYLVGSIETKDDGYDYLEPTKNQYYWESDNKLVYFALVDETAEDFNADDVLNEDDELEALGVEVPLFREYRLCVRCGGIGHVDGNTVCGCGNPQTVKVRKINNEGKKVYKCGLCGGFHPRGSVVRRFYLSEDAVSSVLATALYQKIPKRKVEEPFEADPEDALGSYFAAAAAEEEKWSKQLLVFSDSRQNAAYFATYLSSTYEDLLAKSILVKVLEEHRSACLENRWTIKDFHKRVLRYIQEHDIIQDSVESMSEEVWRWIMREFAADTSQTSLERMGLTVFVPDFDQIKNGNMLWEIPFLKNKGFNSEEVRTLYSFFLDQFRINRAVEYPEAVDPCDPYFEPRNQQGGFWTKRPSHLKQQPKHYSLKGWVPAGERYSNTRLDYLEKLLAADGIKCSKIDTMKMLEDIFSSLIHQQSPLHDYLKDRTLNGAGKIYLLDPKLYKVVPGRNNPEIKYYRCTECHRVTRYNIRGVCPSYRCEGKLVEIDLEQELENNHYRYLYLNMKPETLVCKEHTAQLATEYAAKIQTGFISGDINVLSCSTTFELGVDVGELETVFMKNVPPTPANYAQRAGRAGRRTSSTAYALTYARLSSHDFNHFQEPEKMISGIVRPPYFSVDNIKIAKRHMYACAFAFFWRTYEEYFNDVAAFFCSDGPKRFREFLLTKPAELKEMLLTVIPPSLHQAVGVEDWQWVEELYARDGLITKVTKEITQDLNDIETAYANAIASKNLRVAERLERVGNTIKSRALIGYLAQKNLLPKYGFPVDVVPLEIPLHTTDAKNIDLSRDMQLAISEYAPESEVVADGKLWTSRYVKRIPTKELLTYWYVYCRCGYFHKKLETEKDQHQIASCPVCGNSNLRNNRFVVPEFGFLAEPKSGTLGSEKPERTYSSRSFFSGESASLETKDFWFSGLVRISTHTRGKLTVVNSGRGYGFYLCNTCGYGSLSKVTRHKNVYGYECKGSFDRVSLGYDFETDIVQVDCTGAIDRHDSPAGYWESLMFSLIEGLSYGLDIDRSDIDGTLYIDPYGRRTIILYDTVPGGAGHVKRLMEGDNFRAVLEAATAILERCNCGSSEKDTSCYGCLRNYRNQYLHDLLRRDYALDALQRILA